MKWGLKGKGTWITVYTNPGHAFAVIAGLRLDTSTGGITSRKIARTAERGPRWRVELRKTRGFKKRHARGGSEASAGAPALQLSSRSASRLRRRVCASRSRRCSVGRLGDQRRDLDRPPVLVERDHRQVGGVRVAHDPVARLLGLHAHADLHRGPPRGVDRRR